MKEEMTKHLTEKILPFWHQMRDADLGGFYGGMDYDLNLEQNAVKGCILNSRITWFFSEAYRLFPSESCRQDAQHGFAFLRDHCLDYTYGGVYWSLNADGTPLDTTKHTYNQAFSIYALAAYYQAFQEEEALITALQLYDLIEDKCRDKDGYLEAFNRSFQPVSNEKLSENGVIAERTMNTLLHVLEAYTELYRISGQEKVRDSLIWILKVLSEKIYNPRLHRLEVFFSKEYESLLDLHSFGHDIEAAWLIDRALEVVNDPYCNELLEPVTKALAQEVFERAFNGQSMANESENGVINTHRIWWVQAETVVGFLNAYQKEPEHEEYKKAAEAEWQFIQQFLTDKREGSEWFWEVDETGKPFAGRPIVEPWKCPYHNGRMCFEVIRRLSE